MRISLSKLSFFFLLVSVCLVPAGWAQSANPAPAKEPVAVIGKQEVFEEELMNQLGPQLQQLRNQEYQLKNRALERLIDQKLLEAEAKKKGVAVDKLLEREVDAKIADPTDGEVEAFYLGQKDRVNVPFDQAKAQLRTNLKQAKIQPARQAYLNRLRQENQVTVLLRPPKVEVAYDPARVRGKPAPEGKPDAAVLIVEFSDFQCPFCRKTQPALQAVLAKYDGRVRLAFRDFPLRDIHPQAQMAAEALRCAGEQGKFWEYHDLLFAAGKLERDALLEQALGLKLDEKQFDACLSGGKYKECCGAAALGYGVGS